MVLFFFILCVLAGSGFYTKISEGHDMKMQKDLNAKAIQYINQFGREGKRDGEFGGPFGIHISGDKKVYVADDMNHSIQIFSSEGRFLKRMGITGYKSLAKKENLLSYLGVQEEVKENLINLVSLILHQTIFYTWLIQEITAFKCFRSN